MPFANVQTPGKGFALDIPLWLRFGLWLGARKHLGLWVPLWQAALKDTRSRHKRPPPRCAGPLHLFRFAARASLTAACQSGGRVTVICVREDSANLLDPQIGNFDYGALADGVGHGCRLLLVRQALKPCCCSMSQRRSL